MATNEFFGKDVQLHYTGFTSRGEIGRRNIKSRRLDLRLARRYGKLPPPSVILKKYGLTKTGKGES